ncbi:LytR/AlgR family response regulator transcription factor [Priestia sp. TGN 0903]|uniref:LytR/AlgR family response regulator transcription factor n=1 Tax=Priestia sp. TGN 0903 TaxID=3420730 RepID=UPI003D777101
MKIAEFDNNLIIQKRSEIHFLPFSDILYIERFGNSTIIHINDEEIVIRISLQKLIDFLPKFFLRTHKSYIINIKRVKQMKFSGGDSTTYEAFFNYDKSALVTKDKISIIFE